MTRTCTVPGCQGVHYSRDWCRHHYDQWRRHGGVAGEVRQVLPHHIEQMLALAAEGLSRSDIAAITDWSVQTVGKHIGHIVPARHLSQHPDVARYRRMLKAVASAEYGSRDDIARRFGLKDRFSLKTTLVTARRRVCAASRCGEKEESHGA